MQLAIIAAVFLGVWLGLQIIASPFGVTIGIVLIVGALAYGAYASWKQAVDQRFWDHVKDVSILSGTAFERHVAETYRRLGYRVRVTKQSGDAGVDVIAEKGSERLAIQTKQYAGSVGNDSVQQAHTGKTIYNCTQAIVVCTSSFTSAAQAAARATNVELIDGKGYAQLMQQTQPRALRWLPIPTGPPLFRELAGLGAGILVLFVHSVGPALIQSNVVRYSPADDTPAATFTPMPLNTFQPALTAPTERPSPTLPKHREAAKHPPWWTPPPVNTPSPVPLQTEAAVATPAPQVTQVSSPIPSVTPEATAAPTLTTSPAPSPTN